MLCCREPGSGWAQTGGQEPAASSGWAAEGAGAGQWGGAAGGAQLVAGVTGKEKKSKSRVHRGNEMSPETASTKPLP